MQEHNAKYMDLSACAWTFGGGGGGFFKASRPGFDLFTTPEKILLTAAVNAKYAERHPDEPQLITGFEMHVPNEASYWVENVYSKGGKEFNNVFNIRDALVEAGIACAMVTPNNHHFSVFRAATSSDPKERKAAKERLDHAYQVAKVLKAKTMVLWNGGESYSNPFEVDWDDAFHQYISTLRYAAEKAEKQGMYVAVEPKPFEPGDEMIPNNSGYLIGLLADATLKGEITIENYARIGVNDEMGHVVMANCDLMQNFQFLRRVMKNYHAHLNRQFSRGKHDTDNEIEINIDTLAVISTLISDPIFMHPMIRRFAGFDYQFRHHYTGEQGLLSLYANGLRTRKLEKLGAIVNVDPGLKQLRDQHRYVELNARLGQRIGLVAADAESEIGDVGREGISVPKSLEKRLKQMADN
ncbi:MAG: TIM barrel protein [Candidatus Woesearchaeota archaeon]